jgi:hypothetical protein
MPPLFKQPKSKCKVMQALDESFCYLFNNSSNVNET